MGRTKSYKDYNQDAINKVESILKALDIEYEARNDDIIQLKCPVHGSDDMGHSVIYKNTGIWLCFSGSCHDKYSKNIIGLIRGTLEANNKPCGWKDVLNIINDKNHIINTVTLQTEVKPINVRPETEKLETIIPSKYFLNRGYDGKILTDYEVGDCVRGIFANRAIVPIRYINGEYLGFSARIHWPKCKTCGYHHSRYETCISDSYEFNFMHKKWYHSKGLQKSRVLYGMNKIPAGTKKIALVEGPGCVWKLAEHNIPAIACLGKDFNNERVNILKDFGIEKILFAPDNDEAGQEFRDRFVDKYYKNFGIFFPKLNEKDISEMSKEDIKKYVVSKWEKI